MDTPNVVLRGIEKGVVTESSTARRLSILKKLRTPLVERHSGVESASVAGSGRKLSLFNYSNNGTLSSSSSTSSSVPSWLNDSGNNLAPISISQLPKTSKLTGGGGGGGEKPSVSSGSCNDVSRVEIFSRNLGPGGRDAVVGGAGSSVVPGASNMAKLLEELHRSRQLFEQDQRDFEQVRRETEETDKQIDHLEQEIEVGNKRETELMERAAIKQTTLGFVVIRNTVMDESIQALEKMLNDLLEELYTTRINCSSLSSEILSEAIHSAKMLNGTDTGRQNRQAELERQKEQLETELADFLYMKKGLSECVQETEELEVKWKEDDANHGKLQEQINSLNTRLKSLELDERDLINSVEEEFSKLKQQIEEKEASVAQFQAKSRERNATVKAQNSITTNLSKESFNNNPGNRLIQSQIPSNRQNTALKSIMKSTQDMRATAMPITSFPTFQTPTKSQAGTNPISSLPKFQTPVKSIVGGMTSNTAFPKFQTPVKSQVGTTLSTSLPRLQISAKSQIEVVPRNQSEDDGCYFGESNSNDEDLCLAAAAAEVSQNMRLYEPVTPTPSYAPRTAGPPPSKVRVFEKQPPITSFMRQMSSASVITKPKRPKYLPSQARTNNNSAKATTYNPDPPAAARIPATTTTKTFQFKKKSVSNNVEAQPYNHGRSSLPGEKHDASSLSFDDDSAFSPNAVLLNEESACSPVTSRQITSGLFDHTVNPLSTFNSSRILLTDSQEERLLA